MKILKIKFLPIRSIKKHFFATLAAKLRKLARSERSLKSSFAYREIAPTLLVALLRQALPDALTQISSRAAFNARNESFAYGVTV